MRAHPLPEARAYADLMLARAAQGHPDASCGGSTSPTAAARGATYLATTRGDGATSADAAVRRTTPSRHRVPSVTLVDFDPDAEDKLLAAICYPHTHLPEHQLLDRVRALGDRRAHGRCCRPTSASGRTAATSRAGRFERIDYRFDVLADYGAFRDLQRHRMLTIEWQPLTPAPRLRAARRGRRRRRTRHAFDAAMERSAALYDALVERFPAAGALRRVAWPTGSASSMQITPARPCTCSSCARRPQGHPPTGGRPGDAPPDRRAGRTPGGRRDDALRRPS